MSKTGAPKEMGANAGATKEVERAAVEPIVAAIDVLDHFLARTERAIEQAHTSSPK
jgi:hypothetical protein